MQRAINNLNEAIKYVKDGLLYDEDQYNELFLEFIFFLNDNFDSIDVSTMFSLLHELRLPIYKLINDSNKKELFPIISRFIKLESNQFAPQMVEFCGVIYKQLSSKIQNEIFDLVSKVSERLIKTNRGIVAYLTFLKYTNKTYTTEQLTIANEIIAVIEEGLDPDLYDTVEYAKNNIKASFIPNNKKVLLFIPELLSGSSFLQPPLCFMKAYMDLTQEGISVDLFDNRIYNYSIDKAIDLIKNKYDYIIISSTPIDQFQNYFVDHRFIVFCDSVNQIYEKANAKKIIVCGSHGTVDYKLLLKDIKADIVIQGEYDCSSSDVIKELENNKANAYLNRFYYGNTQIVSGGNDNWEDSCLDFSIVDLEDYFGYKYIENTHVKKRKWAILQATRGCPFKCTFCFNVYGNRVRLKKIDNLIKEIKQLYLLGCKEFFFIDQTFTINKEYTRELCRRIIEENIHIDWQCETRVDCIDNETVALMKNAGCIGIWLGIESFNQDVLDKAKKGYTLEQLNDAIDILQSIDIEYRAFVMVGMEGETVEGLNHTISIIKNKRVKLSKSIIRFSPRIGTEYYSNMDSKYSNIVKHFWMLGLIQNSANDLSEKEILSAINELMLLAN